MAAENVILKLPSIPVWTTDYAVIHLCQRVTESSDTLGKNNKITIKIQMFIGKKKDFIFLLTTQI